MCQTKKDGFFNSCNWGVVAPGNYNVPFPVFDEIYLIWAETGINYAGAIDALVHFLWDCDKDDEFPAVYSDEKLAYLNAMIRPKHILATALSLLFTTEQYAIIQAGIYRKAEENARRMEYANRRIEATRYTANSDVRKQVLERDNHACVHCGAKRDLTLDHVKPVSKGGENSIDNLQTLCRSCNSKKGAN